MALGFIKILSLDFTICLLHIYLFIAYCGIHAILFIYKCTPNIVASLIHKNCLIKNFLVTFCWSQSIVFYLNNQNSLTANNLRASCKVSCKQMTFNLCHVIENTTRFRSRVARRCAYCTAPAARRRLWPRIYRSDRNPL